ncbi:hypothetical protein ZEAMMB73_Zm00001d034041 [Zea mays]|uniref:Uncharacterized protein n=1 Tax=Zea mays TaxID=4577 RepID=A0A1D6L4U6_MAIZE|nr:hypothetical protein ZEAMMB73_Zm00001d034041 [Zea mays]
MKSDNFLFGKVFWAQNRMALSNEQIEAMRHRENRGTIINYIYEKYGMHITVTELKMTPLCIFVQLVERCRLLLQSDDLGMFPEERQAWVHALGGGMDGRAEAVLDLPPRLAATVTARLGGPHPGGGPLVEPAWARRRQRRGPLSGLQVTVISSDEGDEGSLYIFR